MNEMPAKEEGRHRWVALAQYWLSDTQVIAAQNGARVNLDKDNRIGLNVGCWDCELPHSIAIGMSCESEAAPLLDDDDGSEVDVVSSTPAEPQ